MNKERHVLGPVTSSDGIFAAMLELLKGATIKIKLKQISNLQIAIAYVVSCKPLFESESSVSRLFPY